MNLTIYGTSSSEGFPSLFCQCESCQEGRRRGGKSIRTRSGSVVDGKILIDFGPDILAQSQKGLPIHEIDHLFFTHSHADHLNASDLHYIIPPFSKRPDGKKLHVYGNAAVLEKLQRYKDEERYHDYLEFHLLEALCPVWVEDYEIIPIPTFHDTKEQCMIYVIRHGGETILFGTDSAYFPEETLESLYQYQYDLIVFDCTSLEAGGHFKNHMGLPDNKRAEDMLRTHGCIHPGTQIAVTHFAHTFYPVHEHVEKLAAAYGYIAAYDGISLDVKKFDINV